MALRYRGRPLLAGLHNRFEELMLSRIQHVSGLTPNVVRKTLIIFAGTKHLQRLRLRLRSTDVFRSHCRPQIRSSEDEFDLTEPGSKSKMMRRSVRVVVSSQELSLTQGP